MEDWDDVKTLAGDTVRQQVHAIVQRDAGALADRFYQAMFADEQASVLLDHQMVNDRLRRSMARWLATLFDPDTPTDALCDAQRLTGEVHARVGVPMSLVTRGARALKRGLCVQLASESISGPMHSAEHCIASVRFVHEAIDLAIDQINSAYVKSANRMTRTEESYRHLFLNQNLQAERERQRSLLLEWSQALLMSHYGAPAPATNAADGAPRVERFAQSPFGLWLQHKASLMFEGAPELQRLELLGREIEQQWLPALAAQRDHPLQARQAVAGLAAAVDTMKQQLASLFDRHAESEDARDAVTRLLHRRFLPTVVKREIALCQHGQAPFAMLMIELDRFTELAATLGPEGSERVLAQAAQTLGDSLRAGDFVFRVGNARFVVLAVEVQRADAQAIADGLRQRLEAAPLRASGEARLQLAVSTGVAMYDGHPDYQQLMTRAEAALRTAAPSLGMSHAAPSAPQ